MTDLTPQEREWIVQDIRETGDIYLDGMTLDMVLVPKARAEAAEARVAELERERDDWKARAELAGSIVKAALAGEDER